MYQSSTLRADTFSRCELACEKCCYALHSHCENPVPYLDLEMGEEGGGSSPKARRKLNSSQKNGSEQEENLKSTSLQWIKNLNPRYSRVTLVSRCPILRLSIDHTMDVQYQVDVLWSGWCLGLQASKCGGRTDRFSHILLPRRRKCFARERVPLKLVLCLLPRNTFVITAPLS